MYYFEKYYSVLKEIKVSNKIKKDKIKYVTICWAFEMATVPAGCWIVISNVAFNCGSSKQGNPFLVSDGENDVASIVLVTVN